MQAIGQCSPKFLSITLNAAFVHRLISKLPTARHLKNCNTFKTPRGVLLERNKRLKTFDENYKRTMSNLANLNGNILNDSNSVNGSVMSISNNNNNPVLDLKRVCIVGKTTRYEFEKKRFNDYTEEEFQEAVKLRGSDYDALLAQHLKHMKTMSSIKEVLLDRGIEFKVCTRGETYTNDLISWADAIITAGGDGTFLSAASKIKDQSKPVIGVNTNPNRSEGHLCLPPKYTTDLGKALDKLANGQFRWLWRQRIRITMKGVPDNFRPIHNGDMLLSRMSNTALSSLDEPEYVHRHELITEVNHHQSFTPGVSSQVLPVLALNEVFIGESLAAVPSYYELKVDNASSEQQKSSGICICTGTGSTAWSYNICRLPDSAVRRVLELAAKTVSTNGYNHSTDGNGTNGCTAPDISNKLVEQVTKAYSDSYIYEPDSEKMLFSVRDPMQNRVFTCSQGKGFAEKLVIRSRCWDAGLCIDGEISYPFNDGAVATLEMLPSDALRTVQLLEDDNSLQ